MKKRWLLASLVLLLLASAAFGCSGGSNGQPANDNSNAASEGSAGDAEGKTEGKPFEGVTLRAVLIGGGTYEPLYESIPEFEQETGAKVEIVFKGNHFDLDKKVKLDFASNTVNFDVMSNHTSFYSQYGDALEPLNSYFTEEDLNDFIPKVLIAGEKDGELLMIPRLADISVYYYRTDLFENEEYQAKFKEAYGYDLAPPETLAQLKDMAIFFTEEAEGITGTQFAGKEEALTGRFYELTHAFGGDFLDENHKVIFNQEAGVQAAQYLRDLYAAGAMPKGMVNFLWDEVAKNFGNGNVAIYSEWPGWYTWMDDPANTKVAGKFGVIRAPKGPSGVHPGWSGAHGFSVTKASENKEAAAAFVKFLTNKQNMYEESKLGALPVRQSVWDKVLEDVSSEGDARKQQFYETLQVAIEEDFRTPPLIKEWIPLSNILYPKLQKIILGDLTAEEGLNQAADEIETMLRDNGYYSE